MKNAVVSTFRVPPPVFCSTPNPDVEDKRKSVAQLVLDTARSQDRAVTFKYASHALNNSFFLNCLVGHTLSDHISVP